MSFQRQIGEFADNLLEAISYSGIREITLGDDSFRKGIKNLKAVIDSVYPEYSDSLSTAFIPEVITGDYSILEKEMKNNYRMVLNPFYNKIHFKKIIPQEPTPMFKILAESFCKGAKLK